MQLMIFFNIRLTGLGSFFVKNIKEYISPHSPTHTHALKLPLYVFIKAWKLRAVLLSPALCLCVCTL